MTDQFHNETLRRQLAKRWPETDDYMTRVGQANNDLMVMAEILRAERTIPTWQDRLAIEDSDLMKRPQALIALRILHSKGVVVESAESIPDYWEWLEAYRPESGAIETATELLLKDPYVTEFRAETDEALWALPEFQDKLKAWANYITEVFNRPQKVTLTQAAMIVNLYQFLDQELRLTHELAADSMRSLFSTDYYVKAGQPAKKKQ